jgi:sensor histidine kinase regulating citrate/malate metabolism
MVGGDNRISLEEGRSYISRVTGTLGPSIRGKVPAFDTEEAVIGIVSVDYLIERLAG